MERGTDFDVSPEDYREYVHGDNDEGIKPIQTEIVGEVTVREFPARSWSPQSAAVGEGIQQIAGRLPQRVRLVLTNLDAANSVFLAPTKEQCQAGGSSVYELAAGAELVMFHTGEVFATCSAGQTATVAMLGEFRDGGQ